MGSPRSPIPGIDPHGTLRPLRLLIAIAAVALFVVPAAGQAVPGLGGAELRAGLTFPERARVGANLFGEVDVGYLWTPPLRVLVGLSVYEATIDREGGGDEGSFRTTAAWVSGRYDLLPWRTLAPYLRGALTLQRVRADAFDAEVDALLQGTYVGVAGGVGARYLLDDSGRLSATAELRRTLVSNVAATAVEIGLRLQLRGHAAYVPDRLALVQHPSRIPRPPPPTPTPGQPTTPDPADTAAERRLAELERAAVEAERALVAARAATPDTPPSELRDDRDRVAVEAMLRQSLARATAAMSSLAPGEETETDLVLTITGDAFARRSPALAPAVRDQIRVLATTLAGYPGHIISVEGHTDPVGDPEANRLLSEQRAESVRAALVAESVDPLWVGSRGFGAQRPVASNETPAGRTLNRRVEIRVSKRACPVPPLPGDTGALECLL
jgi:outer membrane protein OmpA-like peptidoglycan-associated protein